MSSGHGAEQQSQEQGYSPGLASVACRSQVGSCGQVVSLWPLVEYIILPQGPLVTRREFGVDEGTHNPERAVAQLGHQSKPPQPGAIRGHGSFTCMDLSSEGTSEIFKVLVCRDKKWD